MPPPRISALVAAHDEAEVVGETVRALCSVAGLDRVVVVDDGSSDGTSEVARAAGAAVLRASKRSGKGAALEGALARLHPADVWLFVDADLGPSARLLGPILAQVVEGDADLAIAVFPRQSGGGLGMVKRIAAIAIRLLSGFQATEPLSGQRAISSECLRAVRPLARGFGVETAMTIDAARAGFAVIERPVPGLTHRPTGRSVRGFVHRGGQGLDILRVVSVRTVRRR